MAKIQKVWLAVSGALFLIPEFLWSPLWNFSYELWFEEHIGDENLVRDNFLTNSDNANILMIIFTIQAIGLLGLLFWFLLGKLNKPIKIVGLFLSFFGLLAIVFAFIMFYSFSSWR
jgi:hypothetical protein